MHVILNTAAIQCSITDPEIGPPANGRLLFDGLTVTYTCNTGYTLNGSITRTCGENRTWSSTTPTCDGKIIFIHSSLICQFLVSHVTF